MLNRLRAILGAIALPLASIPATLPVWSPAAAAQGAFPPAVTARMNEDKKDCTTGTAQFTKGFVTMKDVNGDGRPDYVLDYAHFICGGSALFCGSGGCTTVVFASSGTGYTKVLDDLVRDLTFKIIKGRPAMLLGLHGSACGKAGSAPCGETLYWNGTKFSPAH